MGYLFIFWSADIKVIAKISLRSINFLLLLFFSFCNSIFNLFIWSSFWRISPFNFFISLLLIFIISFLFDFCKIFTNFWFSSFNKFISFFNLSFSILYFSNSLFNSESIIELIFSNLLFKEWLFEFCKKSW
jgi:hypothetical protein